MKRNLFISLIAITIIFIAWYGLNPIFTKETPANNNQNIQATVITPPGPIKEFSLESTESKGQPFTNQSLKGHWTLLFFGYAQCPDICPRAVGNIHEIYKQFSEQNIKHVPRFIFASLDPTSDKVENLSEFLGRFNKSFIGLTGSQEEMDKLAQSCRVYSWTDPKPNSNGQKVIDHSSMLLLINPHGQLYAVFSPPLNPTDIVKDLQILMN